MDNVTKAQYVIFGIAQACGLTAFFVLIALFSDKVGIVWNESFNVHGFLMMFFMVYFQGLAISSFRILTFLSKKTVMLVHGSINFCVLVLAAVALSAVLDKEGQYSLHGIIGLITFSLYGLQWLVGFGSFLYPKMEEENRMKLKIVHRVIGVMIFSMSMMVAIMGIAVYMQLNQEVNVILGRSDVGSYCISAGLLTLCYGGITVFIARSIFFKDN